MIKQIFTALCIFSTVACFGGELFDAKLKAANDQEIQRTIADQFWTYIRIGDYGISKYWVVGTNEMTEATFIKHLSSVTNPPSSVMLYPDYDLAKDELLLVKTELLLWRSGVKTIRLYKPNTGTWAVKDSPSQQELDFYWRALKQMTNDSQQSVAGYPPQGVGSPEP